jgi:hypothetical protein
VPLRMFRDDGGREWRVWEVRPLRPERRARSDRRCAVCTVPVERRSGADRRNLAETRVRLTNGLTLGWLTFDCTDEKRRLAPVPDGWDALPDRELCELCRRARPAERRDERWT